MRRKLCEVNGLAGPAPAPPFTPGRGERASCPCSLSLLPAPWGGAGKGEKRGPLLLWIRSRLGYTTRTSTLGICVGPMLPA